MKTTRAVKVITVIGAVALFILNALMLADGFVLYILWTPLYFMGAVANRTIGSALGAFTTCIVVPADLIAWCLSDYLRERFSKGTVLPKKEKRFRFILDMPVIIGGFVYFKSGIMYYFADIDTLEAIGNIIALVVVFGVIPLNWIIWGISTYRRRKPRNSERTDNI